MLRDTVSNFRNIPGRLVQARFRHFVGAEFRPFDWCGYRVSSTQQMLCWFELGRRWGTGLFSRWVDSVPDAPVVLDIGANYGVFGWIATRHWPKAMVCGFEPLEDAAVECCKLGCYKEVFSVALGHEPGMARLTLDTRPGINATVQDGTFKGQSWMVTRRTLDSYGLAADVAKIDVEGAELDVIAGGLKTLYACPVVVVECWTRKRVREVSEMLGRKPVRLTRQDWLFRKQ